MSLCQNLQDPWKLPLGVAVDAASIGRFLRKLGYTYKKAIGCHRAIARPSKGATQKLVQAPPCCDAGAS